MARKIFTTEQIIGMLRKAEVRFRQGQTICVMRHSFKPLFVQPCRHGAPPGDAGFCISATSLTGTSQDQPRDEAMCRSVASR